MKILIVLAFITLSIFAYPSIKNEFVYDCLLYHRGTEAVYNILTFLCDHQYRDIEYFKPDVLKSCSNYSEHFRTGNYMGTIHFQNCQMDHIPYNLFAAYRYLHTLNISSMELELLRMDFFVGATALESLNVSNNRLKLVRPAQFSSAINLVTIDLSYNEIDQIDDYAFDDRSVKLQTLDLSHNKLQQISSEAFRKLPNLKSVNLSHNNLTNIKSGTFASQSAMNAFDLSYNKIKTIDLSEILPFFGGIATINMKFNMLTVIRGYDRKAFPHLTQILVQGNPMDCTNDDHFIPLVGISCVKVSNVSSNSLDIGPTSTGKETHSTPSHIGYLTMFFGVLSFIILVVVAVQLLQMRNIVRNEFGMRGCHYSVDNAGGHIITALNE